MALLINCIGYFALGITAWVLCAGYYCMGTEDEVWGIMGTGYCMVGIAILIIILLETLHELLVKSQNYT